MIKTAEEILKLKLATSLQMGKSFSQDRADAILVAMEEYADQHKPKWIPITEPPEQGKMYNIRREMSAGVAYYNKINNSWYGKDTSGKTIEYTGITHYCKLPEL